MNPDQTPIPFHELANLCRWHGYVCLSFPSFVAPDIITHGWGPSTYLAAVSACGTRLADLMCESLNNGGRMTAWSSISCDGQTLMYCDVENEEGQAFVRFYK
jgi:hypothetical protein